MSMTKKQAVELYNVLGVARNCIRNPKYLFTVARLRNALQAEADAINEAAKPAKDFLDWQRTRITKATSYAVKDDNGKPMTTTGPNGQEFVIIPEKRGEYEAWFSGHEELGKIVLDAHSKRQLELQELLKQPSAVELPPALTLPVSCFSESVKGEHIEILMPVLTDDTVELEMPKGQQQAQAGA